MMQRKAAFIRMSRLKTWFWNGENHLVGFSSCLRKSLMSWRKAVTLTCHCEVVTTEAILRQGRTSGNFCMDKQYYIYIMTNKHNTVLYTGVTNDLKRRCYEHREKLAEGFTKRYNITKLVHYEILEDATGAILRE